MVKRLISASYSEVAQMSAQELKQSIKASEGRTILSENVVMASPQAGDITNAEVATAFGADLILLNVFDCFNPIIQGLPGMSIEKLMEYLQHPEKNKENPVAELKKLVGRPVGVNLEPVDEQSAMFSEKLEISKGRISSKEAIQKAEELGFDFICLTGNPGTGVTNKEIAKAVAVAKENFSGLIIAGKMHSAGSDEPVVSTEAVEDYAKAGADILLLPAVGTVQGFTEDNLKEAVAIAKKYDLLTMSAIGTSQESANKETIRQIALINKICGVDIQHIGDAGYGGLAPAENIYEMSVAIRGMRHTINRMARSVNR
ncbi:haloacid dehalogenase-like hydrolase [Candidatus Enterococcus clewellii]|uniref:DUF7916 domain-containing protein n=2 Tax=Candidatus Enterococcus clewellii TaxID=1834193 RepID=A0AAQ3XZT8_9ENTE